MHCDITEHVLQDLVLRVPKTETDVRPNPIAQLLQSKSSEQLKQLPNVPLHGSHVPAFNQYPS